MTKEALIAQVRFGSNPSLDRSGMADWFDIAISIQTNCQQVVLAKAEIDLCARM